MPRFSTKHEKREEVFSFKSFHGGLNKDRSPRFLDPTELSYCRNFKFVRGKDRDGADVLTLKTRQGTTKVSHTALPAAADVKACTYYVNQSQYILATSAKVYYLDGSLDPVEIGSISGTPTFTEFNNKLIIHDSGVTKAWNGTTFETLNCLYNDENIGTGDNSTTEFSGTLAHPAVAASSLTIDFTDTSEKSLTDNGTGRLTGNVDASWVLNITNCADNGAGLIRVTAAAHPYSTSDKVNIASVAGTTEANNSASVPTWTITKIDANTFDLQGSTFTNAYTSGGTVSKNTIIYSSGAFVFKADGAPDTDTEILASYEKSGGAPKSKGGFVRGGRLYVWGDADNTSRVWYTGPNDEDGWDTSSSGGYLDVERRDGTVLVGCLKFRQSILAVKENSIHWIQDYPGDETFMVETLVHGIGGVSHRAVMTAGSLATLLTPGGWHGFIPSEAYGNISTEAELSKAFHKQCVALASSYAYADYNRIDDQLWLTLYDGAGQMPYVHVVDIQSGNLSEYKFAFDHTCYAFVNGEMLIGGADGNLYKLDSTNTVFKDDGTSYSADTRLRGAEVDWGFPDNYKHNKAIHLRLYGPLGVTGSFRLYRNNELTPFQTIAIDGDGGWLEIYADGQDLDIYDMQDQEIAPPAVGAFTTRTRFNYKSLMWEFTDLWGPMGVEVYGADLRSAWLGRI